MKEIGKILLYLIAVVLLGALLAPPLFWGAHGMADVLKNKRVAQFIADTDFQRFFDRAVLIAAFALLWPLIRSLKIGSFKNLGLRTNPRRWRDFSLGLCAAMLLMIVLGAVLLSTGIYNLKPRIPFGPLLKIALSAAGASVLEELLFRGAILGVLRRSVGSVWAVIGSASLYSIVHFIKPSEDMAEMKPVGWLSGFKLIPHAFWQFGDPMLLLGGFTTLFLLGLILGYAAVKTQSLWLPIGIHAGMILGKFGFSKMTVRREDALPWFGRDIQVGLGSLMALALLGLFFWWKLKDSKNDEPPPAFRETA